jgi:hypothetical protein
MPYLFPNGPKYSMASKYGSTNNSHISRSPGPGSYDPDYKSGNPKYTMRMKFLKEKSEITPGPGNYNIRDEKSMVVPSYIFGREKRDGSNSTKSKNHPGPGNYDDKSLIKSRTMPKFTFGRENRSQEKNSKTPGPGQYNYKEYIGKEAPKITMSMKYKRDKNEYSRSPGPATYNNTNYEFYRTKLPSYKIGTSKRGNLNAFSGGSPGPGYYNPEKCTNKSHTKTPAWIIGRSKRPPLSTCDKSVPGVGNYDITTDSAAPKYSMPGRTTYGGFDTVTPGPGQYNSSLQGLRKSPSWVIGTGNRDDALIRKIKENVPGPGMYDSDMNNTSGPKFRFGTEKRGVDKKSDVPGPGQYYIPCSIVDVNEYTRETGKFEKQYKYV